MQSIYRFQMTRIQWHICIIRILQISELEAEQKRMGEMKLRLYSENKRANISKHTIICFYCLIF